MNLLLFLPPSFTPCLFLSLPSSHPERVSVQPCMSYINNSTVSPSALFQLDEHEGLIELHVYSFSYLFIFYCEDQKQSMSRSGIRENRRVSIKKKPHTHAQKASSTCVGHHSSTPRARAGFNQEQMGCEPRLRPTVRAVMLYSCVQETPLALDVEAPKTCRQARSRLLAFFTTDMFVIILFFFFLFLFSFRAVEVHHLKL